jgi:hypothetical protein
MAQPGAAVVAGGEGEGEVGCVMRPCGQEGARVETRWLRGLAAGAGAK